MQFSGYHEDEDSESSMQFIETTRYPRPSATGDSSYQTPPLPWKRYTHPNGDVYYYNSNLRLITPEDICDPSTLNLVLEARDDRIECLQDDGCLNRLADDWELTLSDVTEEAAVIGMYSRRLRVSYYWTDVRGLETRPPEYFWSHVAEYPSHHEDLPPNTEAEFVEALHNAKISVARGLTFPLSGIQIDQVMRRYEHLKVLQRQGRNVIPSLAWLMGAVMPLDEVPSGKTYTDEALEELMDRMRV